MSGATRERFVLSLTCADQPGIASTITGLLSGLGCDLVESRRSALNGQVFLRMEFATTGGQVDATTLRVRLGELADRHHMEWELHDTADRPRVLLMVSRQEHCASDLLYRWSVGQLRIDIPAVVSNHRDFEPLATSYGVPFVHVPVTPDTKPEAEARLLELVDDLDIDLVVLARYMQVLSDELSKRLEGRVINIHHSLLPSFKGAKPYHQAYARGVKLVGATAHYVTADLDEGPIIDQEVVRVDHVSTPEDLVMLGRDAERLALARAVQAHVEHRVLLDGQRTVVFT